MYHKVLENYYQILTKHEKCQLQVFQGRFGRARPFITKHVTHLRKPISAEEDLVVTQR